MPETLQWKTEKRKLSELSPAPYNPRQATAKQTKDLAKSLERFSLADPIVINADNRIIGGHMRYYVLKGKGVEEVDVRVPSRKLSEKEERELSLRLNKNLGEWSYDKLAEFDKDILKEVGFTSEEMDRIFGIDKTIEDNFQTELKASRVQKGDIWQLGDHRLLCGDATDPQMIAKLMDGKKGQLVFTDPPYNVGYNYSLKYRHQGTRKDYVFTQGDDELVNDQLPPEQFIEFLTKIFRNYYDNTTDDMAIYVCHAMSTFSQFLEAFRTARFHYSQTIVWLKNRVILSLGQEYHRVYEPIMFGWKKGKKRYSNMMIPTEKALWILDKKTFAEQLDVWYEKTDPSQKYIHPTQKPVRLAERAITKNSRRGDIILDFCGGSGSTLIAAEQLERVCYMCELDPVFCEGIIRRWEDFAKKEAEKIYGETRTEIQV